MNFETQIRHSLVKLQGHCNSLLRRTFASAFDEIKLHKKSLPLSLLIKIPNRVSEGLAPLDFSHHRTYGSRITAVLKLTKSENQDFIEQLLHLRGWVLIYRCRACHDHKGTPIFRTVHPLWALSISTHFTMTTSANTVISPLPLI